MAESLARDAGVVKSGYRQGRRLTPAAIALDSDTRRRERIVPHPCTLHGNGVDLSSRRSPMPLVRITLMGDVLSDQQNGR